MRLLLCVCVGLGCYTMPLSAEECCQEDESIGDQEGACCEDVYYYYDGDNSETWQEMYRDEWPGERKDSWMDQLTR